MKNKKFLMTLSLVSLFGMVACEKENSSVSDEKPIDVSTIQDSSSTKTSDKGSSSTVVDSTNDSSGEKDSSSPKDSTPTVVTWKEALTRAINKDYSNMTVNTLAYSESVEETGESILYYDDYQIILSDYFGTTYTNYYHDYNDVSYQWFDGDEKKGEKDGWLTKGYNDAYVGLGLYSYLDARRVLSMVDKYQNLVSYSYGTYYIVDEAAVNDIVSTCFMWCPDVSVDTFFFTIDSFSFNFKKMGVFDTEIDTDKNQSFFVIDQVGSTIYDDSKLPEEPTSENVLEYWQFKGWTGPSIHLYPSSLTLAADQNVTPAEDGTYTLEIEKNLLLTRSINYTYPEGVEEARIIKENGDFAFQTSDASVAEVGYDKANQLSIMAIGAGDCEIYATCKDENGQIITSNKIKVHVNELAKQNKDGATFDFTFDGLIIEDEVYATNHIKNSYDFEILASAGVEVVTGPSTSTLFANKNALVMRTGLQESINKEFSGGAATIFDFKDHKVTGISFYYGQVYDNRNNFPEFCQKISIETSLDGNTWTEAADITDEVKNNNSSENLHLMEKNFTAASQVRIVMKGNFIGKCYEFSTAGIAFIGEEELN